MLKPTKAAHIKNGEDLTLKSLETNHILHVMEMTGGKVEGTKGVAAVFGIKPVTLRHRMGKLGVPFGRAANRR